MTLIGDMLKRAAVAGVLGAICSGWLSQQATAATAFETVAPLLAQLPNTGMLTLTAHKYLQSEQDIEDALMRGSLRELERQLDIAFTVRTPGSGVLDASQWLKLQSVRGSTPWIVRDLHTQTVKDLCIVSFVLMHPKTRHWTFVVDVWVDAQQKLLTRYEGPVSTRAYKAPIDGKGEGSGPIVRPDGRG